MATPQRDDDDRTVVGAVARAGALLVRDLLLNTGVLLSLVVGVGGVLTGRQPWLWLGPLLGVAGVVVSFAGHRERVVRGPDGEGRRATLWPSPAIWVAAVAVPVVDLLVMAAMWW